MKVGRYSLEYNGDIGLYDILIKAEINLLFE